MPQDHTQATFTKKITKESGHVTLTDDAATLYRKVRAFDIWPRVYFTTERGGKEIRVVITDAEYKDGVFTPTHVIPEGKKEMPYTDFLRGQK